MLAAHGAPNDVAVALIAMMFVSFLLQIVFRYVLNRPLGWTEEVTVLCWVWVVLWGASFVLDDEEEIRFDIVYDAGSGARAARLHDRLEPRAGRADRTLAPGHSGTTWRS